MDRYRDALPAGSFFAASQWALNGVPDSVLEQWKKEEKLYGSSRNPGYFRNRLQFQNCSMVGTWIVWLPEWNPEDGATMDGPGTSFLTGVGKK